VVVVGVFLQDDVLIEDAVPSVLRHADTNGDGQLSFEEFAALLQVGCLTMWPGGVAAYLTAAHLSCISTLLLAC